MAVTLRIGRGIALSAKLLQIIPHDPHDPLNCYFNDGRQHVADECCGETLPILGYAIDVHSTLKQRCITVREAAAICRLRENRVLQFLEWIDACTHPGRENSARSVNASPEPSSELIVKAACGAAADVIGFLHWK
jgi:hypothetical protein